MRDEYNFSKLKSLGKGKYAEKFKNGTNIFHLDPDIADFYKDEQSVNSALRLLMDIAKKQLSSHQT